MRTVLALFLLGIPALANAASIQVMTFTEIPVSFGSVTWVEGGITATSTSGLFGPYETPDAVHLDGSGPYTARIEFTTGSLFTPISVDIRPLSSGYCAPRGCVDGFDPLDYLSVSGFVDDLEVSSLALYLPPSSEFETILLEQFPVVDRLRVQVLTYSDFGLPGSCSTGVGCGHFDLDNVVISPAIPEPAAAVLFAAGLLCVGFSGPRTPTS